MHYVYLHGFCSGPRSHKGLFFAERMQEHGHVLHLPDLNDGDFANLTISRELEVLHRTIEALPPGDVTLFGSSLGGFVSGLYAREHPRVKALVLLAPAFQFLRRNLRIRGKLFFDEWQRQGSREFYHYAHGENRALHYGIVDDAQQYDDVPIGAYEIPALILQGLYDEDVPPETALEYHRQNTASELVLLHSDHRLTDVLPVLWRYTRAFLNL